jgi:hypothetical protein
MGAGAYHGWHMSTEWGTDATFNNVKRIPSRWVEDGGVRHE